MPQPSASDARNLPAGIGRPALRALTAAGITSLRDLSRLREVDLLQMHGVGPRAVRLLKESLSAEGLSLQLDC